MATYEGLWRCGACGRVNLGRNDSCPGCGFHTNDETEFFLPQSEAEINALIVEDEKLLKMASDGPNWFCGHCGNQNRAPLQFCASCGNPRSVIPGSIEKARDGDGSFQEEVRNDYSDWAEGRQPPPPAGRLFATPLRTAGAPSRSLLWLILSVFGGCALLVFLCLLSTLFTGPSTADLKMTALEWKRTVYVEEYRLEDHEGWDDEVPGDAKILSKKRSVRSYNQVPVGTRTVQESYTEKVQDGTESYTETVSDGTERYKCGVINKKNGFFQDRYCTRSKYKTVTKTRPKYRSVSKTRPREETIYESVPVMGTLVNYRVWRWSETGQVDSRGSDFEPQWGAVTEDQTHRAGRKTEEYSLVLMDAKDPGKVFRWPIKPDQLNRCSMNTVVVGKVDRSGRLISLEGF